jgi:hypothetical protein
LIPYIAPIFLPIAVYFGHLFRLYDDRHISLEEGMRRRFFYHLPVILQSFILITLLIFPLIIKDSILNRYLDSSPIEEWWWLLILPILFQVMMIFLPSLMRRKWRKGWFLTVAILSTLFFISIHFPIARLLTPSRSAYPVSKAIHEWLPPNKELFQYRTSLYGIDFYNKIRTPLVGACGELGFGFLQLSPAERSHYFLSPEKFYQLCQKEGDVYCVTQYEKNVDELGKRVSLLEVLWDNGEFYLLRLRG